MALSLAEALHHATQTLQQAGIEQARLDARLLVEWATATTRLDALARPELALTPEQGAKLDAALQRRVTGEPTHRIIGTRGFYGLDFTLSTDTLEPRPDTETLIDLVLPFLQTQANPTALDMGTGSGAIAIALLHTVPQLRVTAVDISAGALATARQNAASAGVEARFTTCESDWFASVTGRFDLIISNPPYIPHGDIAALDKSVRDFDPLRALDGGADGLDFYRLLAAQGRRFLNPQGKIAVEIGFRQKEDVTALFTTAGFTRAAARADLGGIEPALLFSTSNSS
ncbi:MAG: Release factor glutamine methyltransferase [Candidatus Tokpelaia hoelldobleri]|uniref:Release factor glutamine methyltransferase n=1 Tax=Candidatus Tokpelaia hoelldobleri TaxID=1902579 RepID=A0A1U9JT16_9HYPH|nr:MAG: Release factor glutamine methyltransferase [Candidatus Tokpelaia hoelldoblerii]